MPKALVSWIGKADLDASASSDASFLGPLASGILERGFDRAHLLCNYPKKGLDRYLKWLAETCPSGVEISSSSVKLSSPTNYADVYQVAQSAVQGFLDSLGDESPDLTFHLSPGTPTMTVVWILLASSRYPAQLIQSSIQRGVQDVDLPFEIASEFIPHLVRQSKRIEQLAAGLPAPASQFEAIIHQSEVMKEVIAKARVAAARDVRVLIEGESGTGKELLAIAIHHESARFDGPFIAVNCGAIPEGLAESTLFGHVKGAFTGADKAQSGVFEAADRGTLFLDEVGELPLNAQVRLLRTLQQSEVTRVGTTSPIKVNVRVIAATNRVLAQEVADGRFREDLYYRLAVAVLQVPPLRERKGDLSLLVDHYLRVICQDGPLSDGQKILSPSARNLLLRHLWPGNVRELVNVLTRAVIWSPSETIGERDIIEAMPPSLQRMDDALLNRPLGNGLDIRDLVATLVRHYLERALNETAGNKSRAAELVGLPSYQTLTNWLKRYGMVR